MGCKKSKASNPLKKGETFAREDIYGKDKSDFFVTYQLKDLLGAGAFGQVNIAENRKTKSLYAAKILRKNFTKDVEEIKSEIEKIQKLDHPNIVKVLEYYPYENTKIYILMELCQGGELFDEIIKKFKFSEEEAAQIMHPLLAGLNHMHLKGVVHRDIKPENIMLIDNSYSNLKIVDFGTAMWYSTKDSKKVGTAYYIAPEVVTESKYSPKCDIFACGVILYILLTGTPPFNGKSDEIIMKKIAEEEANYEIFNNKISPDACDLIKKMLVKNPEKRLTADEALQHPWMKKFQENIDISKEDLEDCVKSMKKFKITTKLQQGIWNILTVFSNIKEEEKEKTKIFLAMDKNNDGFLTKAEIKSVLQSMHCVDHTEKEINEMIERADTNHVLQINFIFLG